MEFSSLVGSIDLIKSGYAGTMRTAPHQLFDRRIAIKAEKIGRNPFLGIPAPEEVKKLHMGKVCTIIRTDDGFNNTPDVFVRFKKTNSCSWVYNRNLKPCPYVARKEDVEVEVEAQK